MPFYIIRVLDNWCALLSKYFGIVGCCEFVFAVVSWRPSIFYAISRYIKEMKQYVVTEQQLIYLCHLFGPFMMRLDQEKPRVGYELTTLLYEMLEQVDNGHAEEPIKYMDSICDLLWVIHIFWEIGTNCWINVFPSFVFTDITSNICLSETCWKWKRKRSFVDCVRSFKCD